MTSEYSYTKYLTKNTKQLFFTVFVSLNLYGKPKRLKDEMDPSHPTMDWKTLIWHKNWRAGWGLPENVQKLKPWNMFFGGSWRVCRISSVFIQDEIAIFIGQFFRDNNYIRVILFSYKKSIYYLMSRYFLPERMYTFFHGFTTKRDNLGLLSGSGARTGATPYCERWLCTI